MTSFIEADVMICAARRAAWTTPQKRLHGCINRATFLATVRECDVVRRRSGKIAGDLLVAAVGVEPTTLRVARLPRAFRRRARAKI